MFNLPVLLAAAGLVGGTLVLALLERLRKGPMSAAPKLVPDPAPLRTAASLAYDYAKEHRLPVAAAAERRSPDDVVAWFEDSLRRTVSVSGSDQTVSAKSFRAYLRWAHSVW
jgi:hypothetical protein